MISLGHKVRAAFVAMTIASNFSLYLFSFGGNYYPEVGIALILIFSHIYPQKENKIIAEYILCKIKYIFYAAIFLFSMLLLGGVTHGNWSNSYAEFRSVFCLLIAYFLFSSIIKQKNYQYIYFLCISSAIFSLCMYFLGVGFDDDSSKYPSPIYFPAVAVILACRMRDSSRAFFAFSLVCALSSVSFFRQYWIVSFACLLFILNNLHTINIQKNKNSTILILIGMVFSAFFGYFKFIEKIETNESLYIQSVGKTDDLFGYFSGESDFTESDLLRYDYFRFILYKWYDLLIPHGLGSKGFYGAMSDWFSGYDIPENSLDSGLLFSVFHFGYIFFIPLCFYFYLKAYIFLKNFGLINSFSLFMIIFVPFIFDGGSIVVLPRAISIGLLLSVLNLSVND